MLKFFLPLVLFSSVAFAQTPASNWETLSEENYTVQYPSDWDLDQSGTLGTSFFMFSPVENDDDTFRENINLIQQSLEGLGVDLAQFVEVSEGQIKSMITNAKMIESKTIKNGNIQYHKFIYTGDQGQYHLKFEQYFFLQNEQAYVLTFTSESSKFADYQAIGEKILQSFSIK